MTVKITRPGSQKWDFWGLNPSTWVDPSPYSLLSVEDAPVLMQFPHSLYTGCIMEGPWVWYKKNGTVLDRYTVTFKNGVKVN